MQSFFQFFDTLDIFYNGKNQLQPSHWNEYVSSEIVRDVFFFEKGDF